MTNLFTQLDAAWTRRHPSSAALDILARWADSEPTLACFSTMYGDGRLILVQRRFGVATWDVAAEGGNVAARILQCRTRAEDAGADMAVA